MTFAMTQRNILFITPTRIGDAVLSTAVLAHILKTEPEARVTIVTSPLSAPLFEGYPQLERIVRIRKRSYNRHWRDAWLQTIGTRWHAVWDIRSSILSYIVRTGKRHIYKPQTPAPKITQYASAFGIEKLPYPTLWPRVADTQIAQATLPDGTKYLVLAPIANWTGKEWPLDKFITLAKSLLTGFCTNYRPVIICAGHERTKALPMLDALTDFRPVDLTAGDASLLTIFACMQRAHGFIGNDSGLMHMAAAAAIPTLGLFGPTPSLVYQPWGRHAAFLRAPEDDLQLLTPNTVAEKFQALISA